MRFKALQVPDAIYQRHPGSRWVTWRPTPRGPQWLVRLDFGKPGGNVLAECIGIEVRSFRESADEGWPNFLPTWDGAVAPLHRRTLRDLPLGQILNDLSEELLDIQLEWAEAFRVHLDDGSDEEALADADAIEAYVKAQRLRKSGRTRGIPDLAAIAHVYLNARRNQRIKAVAEWGNVSESTAAKWIMRVRQETNLLPEPANRSRAPRSVQRKRGAS